MLELGSDFKGALRLGRYEAREELGRGAMGIVYKGVDPIINRYVALKLINPDITEKSDMARKRAIARFYREASAAGRLSHPALMTVYDMGEEIVDGKRLVYIAMEYLDGSDLSELIASKAIEPTRRKRDIVRMVAEGLGCAHQNNIVHRDIKPSNIRALSDSSVKITDFGLAMIPDSDITLDGTLLGTPQYISPEQARGQAATPASDFFALTAIFYEMLTYRRPFDGPSIAAVLGNVLTREPRPVSEIAPGLPPGVDRFITRGLAKDPAKRFSRASEYIKALDEALDSELIEIAGGADRSESIGQAIKDVASIITIHDRDLALLRPKLSALIAKRPLLNYHFDDERLDRVAPKFFGAAGFMVKALDSKPTQTFAKRALDASIGRKILLLRYSPKQSDSSSLAPENIIRLLRQMSRLASGAALSGVAPIFFSTRGAQDHMALFKKLAEFGIHNAAFIDANKSPESAAIEILRALAAYSEAIDDRSSSQSSRPLESPGQQSASVTIEADESALAYENLIKEGERLAFERQYELAAELYTQALRLRPDPQVYVNRGDAYFGRSLFIRALQDYRAAVKSRWNAPDVEARIGACCLSLAASIGANDDEKSRQWFTVGMRKLEGAEKRIGSYIAQYEKTPEKIPANPYSPIGLALSRADFDLRAIDDETGRLASFVGRILKKMDAVDIEGDLKFVIARAGLLRIHGRCDEAVETLSSVLPKEPRVVSLELEGLATFYRRRGSTRKAFEIYRALLREIIPNRATVLKNFASAGLRLGVSLRAEGKSSEALEIFYQLIDLEFEKKEWFYAEMAMAYLAEEDFPRARRLFEIARGLNPEMLDSTRMEAYRSLVDLIAV